MAINPSKDNPDLFDPLALDTEKIQTQCTIETAHAISMQQKKFRDLQRELRGWGSYGCLTSTEMMKVIFEIHGIKKEMSLIEGRTEKLEKDMKRYTGGN